VRSGGACSLFFFQLPVTGYQLQVPSYRFQGLRKVLGFTLCLQLTIFTLPIVYCLLSIAYCLLPIAYCLLPIAKQGCKNKITGACSQPSLKQNPAFHGRGFVKTGIYKVL
jgi:hypothetical protein